jgi:MFS family permease
LDRNLRLLGVGAGVRLFGAAMVYPYIALYLKNVLNFGYAEIGIILLLISVVPLGVAPFGGLIADRAGRRKTFLLSLGGEAAAVLLVALSMRSDWFPGVLLGGIGAGVSGSVAGPAISAYVADFAVGSNRTKAYTWIRIGFNAGFTVGVALGGYTIGFLGFPDTGILSSGILTVSTLFLFLLLSPSPYDLARSKVPGTGDESAETPPGPGSIRDSISILAHDRQFLIFCLASALVSLTYGQWSTTFPLFVNTVLNVPYWILGTALALNGAIVIFGQTATTNAMLGRRHTSSAFLAIALMIVSFVTLGALSLYGAGVLVAVFSFIVILTIGENLGAIPGMTLSSNLASKTEIGAYNGAFQLLSGIGGAFAPTVGGFTLAATTNPLLVWGVLAIPGVPAMLLFLWLGSRIPAEANRI